MPRSPTWLSRKIKPEVSMSKTLLRFMYRTLKRCSMWCEPVKRTDQLQPQEWMLLLRAHTPYSKSQYYRKTLRLKHLKWANCIAVIWQDLRRLQRQKQLGIPLKRQKWSTSLYQLWEMLLTRLRQQERLENSSLIEILNWPDSFLSHWEVIQVPVYLSHAPTPSIMIERHFPLSDLVNVQSKSRTKSRRMRREVQKNFSLLWLQQRRKFHELQTLWRWSRRDLSRLLLRLQKMKKRLTRSSWKKLWT